MNQTGVLGLPAKEFGRLIPVFGSRPTLTSNLKDITLTLDNILQERMESNRLILLNAVANIVIDLRSERKIMADRLEKLSAREGELLAVDTLSNEEISKLLPPAVLVNGTQYDIRNLI